MHWVQRVRRAKSFDGRDLISIVHEGEIEARKNALAIDMDRARAALPVVATFLRSGEHNRFAYAIQ